MDVSMDSGGNGAINWCPNSVGPGNELGPVAGNGGESCSSNDFGESSIQVEEREIILITNQPPAYMVPPLFRTEDEGADYLFERIRVTCAKKNMFPAVEDGWLRRDCV